MSGLKEVRDRISSVSSTKQITSAMKMVSAAKLRRAQEAITQMRPYAEKLNEILLNLSASLDTSEGIYGEERDIKSILLIPVSSNRGLCGAFNSNIVKQTKKLIQENKGTEITVLPVGKKIEEAFKSTKFLIKGNTLPNDLNDLFDDLNFNAIIEPSEQVMHAFVNKQFDQVFFIYNKFKNAASQEVNVEQFLPVLPPSQEDNVASSDYIFEPNKEQIVEELIPKSLKTQFYKVLLDSFASEHGARMTAMHKATDNANDMLKELKLRYNKARQAAITNEILEIVGGAEALNG